MITLARAEELLHQLTYVGLEAENSKDIVETINQYFKDLKEVEDAEERSTKLAEMQDNAKLAKYLSYRSYDGYLSHAIANNDELNNKILNSTGLRPRINHYERGRGYAAVCGFRTGKSSGVLMPNGLAFEQEEQKMNQYYGQTIYTKCRKCETIVNRELIAQKVIE